MGDWSTNVALGGIEECIYVWINLRDYGECDTEMQVQSL